MKRILFVCHGNICRSPMAEFILKDLAAKSGKSGLFEIASAAVSDEEEGNPVYGPAQRILASRGISCKGKYARVITEDDYAHFDLLIGMDQSNLRRMLRFFGGDPDNKIRLLMDYTGRPGDVADPWYSGDFEQAYADIEEGCRNLMQKNFSKKMT